jgi:cell division protein FtsL
MMCEGPKLAANDILWEGLIVLIMLICLQECTMSLITNIILHKLE